MKKSVSQKSILFEVVFNRRNNLNKHGQAAIEIRAYQDRKVDIIPTKIFITPQQWDAKRKMIKSNHPQNEVLNTQLQQMINSFERMQTEKLMKGGFLTLDEFKQARLMEISSPSFLAFIEAHVAKNTVNKEKTKTSHLNTVNHLKAYQDEVCFSDIKYGFVEGFLQDLRDKGKATNTVYKQWKILKHYVELAIKHGKINTENPCKAFRLREERVDRHVLSMKELKTLQELDLEGYDKKIKFTRDMFLFACYTGLRISDVVNLKTSYATKSASGWNLEFTTIKVEKKANLPLHLLFLDKGKKKSHAEKLFEQYYDKESVYVFPLQNEPLINRNLKIIAELADVQFNLTFHIGRETFGTYMATKVPIPMLMQLMQHSDVRTTMLYVHLRKEMIEQGLTKVDWNN